jgi:hypothetical protein
MASAGRPVRSQHQLNVRENYSAYILLRQTSLPSYRGQQFIFTHCNRYNRALTMSSTLFALSLTLSLTTAGILELADIAGGFASKLLSARKEDLIVLRIPVVDK